MKNVISRVACAGILIHKEKVLIIQRVKDDQTFPNLWEFPSGKKEAGESAVDGVKREVLEEVGVEVRVGRPISTFNYTLERAGETLDITQINFLVEPIGEVKIKLSKEHQNFAWITEGEINKYNLSQDSKEVIKKAFKL